MSEKIKDLIKTCDACPSQWEGELENGSRFYIRYRWGTLSLRMTSDPSVHPVMGETLFYEEVGDDMDGFMEEERMLELLKEHIHV